MALNAICAHSFEFEGRSRFCELELYEYEDAAQLHTTMACPTHLHPRLEIEARAWCPLLTLVLICADHSILFLFVALRMTLSSSRHFSHHQMMSSPHYADGRRAAQRGDVALDTNADYDSDQLILAQHHILQLPALHRRCDPHFR